jgi:hypothetical protein
MGENASFPSQCAPRLGAPETIRARPTWHTVIYSFWTHCNSSQIGQEKKGRSGFGEGGGGHRQREVRRIQTLPAWLCT